MKKPHLLLLLFLSIFCIKLSAQSCMPIGNVVLNTQTEVDNFIATYGSCDSILGNLDVTNTATIVNLDSLKNITFIQGRLLINGNQMLDNIDGLASLERIVGLVSIRDNAILENLDGLCSLQNVIGAFAVSGNPALENLQGLKSLETIGSNLNIFENNSLKNFDGLDSLVSVRGRLRIRNNALLENIDGLSSLESIRGNLELFENPLLATCCGLFRALNGIDDGPIGPGVAPTYDVGGTITINSNLPGCNTQVEIVNGGICQDPPAIPTLSQWGLLLFGLLVATLGAVGVWNLYRSPETA